MRATALALGALLALHLTGPARAENSGSFVVSLQIQTYRPPGVDLRLGVTDTQGRTWLATPRNEGAGLTTCTVRNLPPGSYRVELQASSFGAIDTVSVEAVVQVPGRADRRYHRTVSRGVPRALLASVTLTGMEGLGAPAPAPLPAKARPGTLTGELVVTLRCERFSVVNLVVIDPKGSRSANFSSSSGGDAQATCTIRDPVVGDYQVMAHCFSGQTDVVGEVTFRGVRRSTYRETVPAGKETPVHTFRLRQGGRLPVSDALPPSQKVLGEALAEMAQKIPAAPPKAGVVVKSVRNRVYVNLGEKDGMKPGDELEIVRAKSSALGGVAARLRVTSVQEKLCVCERLSGIVVDKNERGEWNKVQPPREASQKTAQLAVQAPVEDDAERAQAVRRTADALLASAKDLPLLKVIEPGSTVPQPKADFELRAEARAGGAADGAVLRLQLVELASGKAIADKSLPYKAAAPLADRGFCFALSARAPDRIDMDFADGMVVEKFGATGATTIRLVGAPRTGWPIFIPKADTHGSAAWIFPDGRIVAASPEELSSLLAYDRLRKTWKAVAAPLLPPPAPSPPPSALKETKGPVNVSAGNLGVIIRWQANADLDLSLSGPRSASHERDVMSGPGEERCVIPDAPAGDYVVRVSNLSSRPVPFTLEIHLRGRRQASYDCSAGSSGSYRRTITVSPAPPPTAPGTTVKEAPEAETRPDDEALRKTGTVYTLAADQWQGLHVDLPLSFEGWTLTWPEGKCLRAELTRGGALFAPGSWQFDGQAIRPRASGDTADLGSLRPGKHVLAGRCSKAGGWMSIVALFAEPNGKIGILDADGKPIATREVFSRPLSELLVPACEPSAKAK